MSGMTCAERPLRRCERVAVHAKKEKRGCGVCGAPPWPLRKGVGTRQKRKARLWRVRNGPLAVTKGGRYTPKKEKQGCGVCGAPPSPLRESGGTRQKRKARLWRVRSGPFAVERGWRYTPKKKKHLTFPTLPYKMMLGLKQMLI